MSWLKASDQMANFLRPRRICCPLRVLIGGAVLITGSWLTLTQSGCAPPPHPAIIKIEPAKVDVDSLLCAVTGPVLPASLDGHGILKLEGTEKNLPSLTLRFSLRDSTELRAGGKPGMFSPVFSAWAGDGGWSLRLPRMKAVVEHYQSTIYNDSGPLLTGRAAVRLGWYLFVPQALISELTDIAVFSRGDQWVITGRPNELGGEITKAEVSVMKEDLGIGNCRLLLADGEELIEIRYQPPLVKEKSGDRSSGFIRFVSKSLHLKGAVRVKRIKAKGFDEFGRPAAPLEWDHLPGSRLGDLLEAAFEE